jgi:UDP-N-acetyl-D-mannosaminuronic acid dehydrogenase
MSTVCVHGLGYIGLPTAAMLANYGHRVSGYDTATAVRSKLRDGDIHLEEPGLRAFVTQALESESLEIVDDVVEAKYHIVCVPTPFDTSSKTPDLEYVRSAGHAVADQVRNGDTVILESTVPPGTTTDVFRPIIEESGLEAGTDFALVHCPETVLPGNIITELRENNRIIGGVNGVSTESAVRLYDSFVEGEVRTVSDPTVAEFVKLIQNTFRDVNIGLANEISRLAADYGVDARETIELANSHPRVGIHQPGPGVGGHCLPIDPWFLGYDSDQLDLVATARRINDGMSGYVIDLLADALGTLQGRRIAVLGIAYKGNVGDTRMSPGLKIVEEMRQRVDPSPTETDGETDAVEAASDGGSVAETSGDDRGRSDVDGDVQIAIHDPHVVDSDVDLVELNTALEGADAAVITTDHDEFEQLDPASFRERMAGRLVVDTKDVLNPQAWSAAGFEVRRI